MASEMTRTQPWGGLLLRFYLILTLMVVTVLTGMSTGFGLFYRLLYILGLTAILSYVWTWLNVRSLEVGVSRRTRQARVGDAVEEVITVHNMGLLPKHALEVEDITDLPAASGGKVVSLWWRASRSWTVRMPARKRGVYTLGPLRVASTDPFGMFRIERLIGDTEDVTVLPQTFDLPGFHVPAADLLGDSSLRKRTHNVTPHASAIRDYAPGDSLSRVHWNSTARLGKLVSKEFDLGRAAEVWLIVDLHGDVQVGQLEESTDEYAVSIAASLAKRYLEAELPVGVITYGDKRYYLPAETGVGQLNRILGYLAVSKADGITPLGAVLAKEEQLWGQRTSLVVITSSWQGDWVIALRELSRRGVKATAVLLDERSFCGVYDSMELIDQLYLAGVSTYVVRKGDHIPSALSHPYSRPGVATAERPEEVLSTV